MKVEELKLKHKFCLFFTETGIDLAGAQLGIRDSVLLLCCCCNFEGFMKLSFCNLQPHRLITLSQSSKSKAIIKRDLLIEFGLDFPFNGAHFRYRLRRKWKPSKSGRVTRAWSLRRSPSCKLFQAHLAHPTCENAHHTTKGSEERREEGSVQSG